MLKNNRSQSNSGIKIFCMLVTNIALILSFFGNLDANINEQVFDDKPPADLIHIEFVNHRVGWVVGRIGMFKTTDSGKTWFQVGPDIAVAKDINSISLKAITPILYLNFISENIGWALRNDGIIKTTNGGRTWELISHPNQFYQFDFYNENIGWAFSHSKSVYYSSNGGKSWSRQTEGGPVTAVSLSECWAIVGKNEVAYTTDGGITWIRSGVNTTKLLISKPVVTDKETWVISSKEVYRRDNSSGTWQEMLIAPFNNSSFRSIGFANELKGWVIGNKGLILSTIDGGKSWSEQRSGVNEDLKKIEVIDENTVFVIGKTTILKTNDGGKIWVRLKLPETVVFSQEGS